MNSISSQSGNTSMNESLNSTSYNEQRISLLANKLNRFQLNLQNEKLAKF